MENEDIEQKVTEMEAFYKKEADEFEPKKLQKIFK